jgi:hypothetical protein
MNTGPGLLGDSEVENRFVLTKLPSTSTLVLAASCSRWTCRTRRCIRPLAVLGRASRASLFMF